MSASIVNSIRDNVPELVRVPVKTGSKQGDCHGCWFDAEHPTLPHHRVCHNQGLAITKSLGLGICYVPGSNRHFIYVAATVPLVKAGGAA